MPDVSFRTRQREHFSDADPGHFQWQTANAYLARTEAALVTRVRAQVGERLLEIGCGEGGNLHHLRALGAVRFGVDFSVHKAAFAGRMTGAHTACADAAQLPFADAAFSSVLIRDLLHHVPDRAAVLAEAVRVLRPNGRLILVEPNARSPLVLMQAALVPAERGVLASTAARLRAELRRAGLRIERELTSQPLPLERVLLHPRMGRPAWAERPAVARTLDACDALARRLIPAPLWMYLVFETVRGAP
jgi:SAM-dependent methyltransferase